MRNTEHCDRCLPKALAQAIGYIPLPEMTNIGDTRVDERKILLCNYHYFEAKKNCYFVVPFNRENDPIDSFLSRVNQKHKRLRGDLRLKFKPLNSFLKDDESLPPVIKDFSPSVPKSITKEKKGKIHFLESGKVMCGATSSSSILTTDAEEVTCKNCISLVSRYNLQKVLA